MAEEIVVVQLDVKKAFDHVDDRAAFESDEITKLGARSRWHWLQQSGVEEAA